ncbi:MAG TPA: precorrin-6y C5,15-methyltransferase (decarboxylating) subunit CbiE [Ferrovibrio sp.]|uniref:precorrin-6y C5,15-methyltransferase (decarboxylating) subunit CbiE n=1 Tax=Ferrovibrio sp. TaxID=1917215 RepID=UPI002ED56E04
MSRWLTIVGIGEDGLDGLSAAARTLIDTAEILIGGARHLAFVPDRPGQTRLAWSSPLMAMAERIGEHKGRRVTVLASGDPMWCGIGGTLGRFVPASEMLILPHAGAFSLAAARMAWSLDEVECLTLHGRPLEQLALYLYPGARLLILSENGRTPAAVAAFLARRGFASAEITVLEHMGGPQENVKAGRADPWPHPACADLNTLAVQLRDGPGLSRLPGLDDDLYLHDGQITKREVRAVTLAKLAPCPGDLLWDVGAGAGSVGIEWLRSHRANRAIAIEQNESRRSNIAQNAAALGVPQLEIRAGSVPAALDGLPAPDAIFIGGGILTDGLVERCWNALKPGGRLVANVVTMEGEAAVAAARRAYGGDLARLGVQRAEPVGRYHGWYAMMPVTQWNTVKE